MLEKRFVLNLRGGLGNQLFGVYAAMALEAEFKVNCQIHTYGIDRNHNSGYTDATAFHYGRELHFVKSRNLTQRLHNNSNIRKISEILKFESWALKHASYSEKGDWEKTLIDLRNLLDSNSKKVFLQGFFQDFSYFNKVRDFLPNFELTKKSVWLTSSIQQAVSLQPIMIHIRLGDYLQNGMQILSKKYFNEALHQMSKLIDTDDVWIFSDSPNQAREFLDIAISKRVKFLENDQKATEALMLMREGSGLICSNSTFSYWAGKTGNPKRPVIFPRKFSLNPHLQIRNVPNEWISLNN